MAYPHRKPTPPPSNGLRLFSADTAAQSYDDGATLSRGMTLRQFFDAWYLPIVMEAERENDGDTVESYTESVNWWERLTGSPTLDRIEREGDVLVARFQTGLRGATWRRSPLSAEKPLAKATIEKHKRQVRAVLYRTGPQTDPARTAKRLIDEVPYIRVQKPKCRPKGSWNVEQVTRLYETAAEVTTPARWGKSAPLRWRAFILCAFYTGIRVGALLQLQRSMLTVTGDGFRLSVPEEIDKVEKYLDVYLRREAGEALLAIPDDGPYFFDRIDVDTLDKRHRRLQKVAGLQQIEGFHHWRRTFAKFYGLAGAEAAIAAVKRALNHSDERTTTESYLNIDPDLIRRFPSIGGRKRDADQKSLF